MVEDKASKYDLNIHNQKNIFLYFCLFLTGRNSVDTKRQSLFVFVVLYAWQCVLNELKCNLSCLRN